MLAYKQGSASTPSANVGQATPAKVPSMSHIASNALQAMKLKGELNILKHSGRLAKEKADAEHYANVRREFLATLTEPLLNTAKMAKSVGKKMVYDWAADEQPEDFYLTDGPTSARDAHIFEQRKYNEEPREQRYENWTPAQKRRMEQRMRKK